MRIRNIGTLIPRLWIWGLGFRGLVRQQKETCELVSRISVVAASTLAVQEISTQLTDRLCVAMWGGVFASLCPKNPNPKPKTALQAFDLYVSQVSLTLSLSRYTFMHPESPIQPIPIIKALCYTSQKPQAHL